MDDFAAILNMDMADWRSEQALLRWRACSQQPVTTYLFASTGPFQVWDFTEND
jgi:hypothetical protein